MKIPVWSISDAHWDSRKNIVVYDDKGTLEYGDGGWTYHGRQGQSRAINITGVELARPKFPWFSQSIGLLLLVAFVVLLSILVRETEFTVLIVMSMVMGLGLGTVINLAQKWVVVTGTDASGNTVQGRFHDAGAFGWMGIMGGNNRLAEALEDHRSKEE